MWGIVCKLVTIPRWVFRVSKKNNKLIMSVEILLQDARPQMNLKRSSPPWKALLPNTHYIWACCWGNWLMFWSLRQHSHSQKTDSWYQKSVLFICDFPVYFSIIMRNLSKTVTRAVTCIPAFYFYNLKYWENRSSFSPQHKMIFIYFIVTTDTSFKLTFYSIILKKYTFPLTYGVIYWEYFPASSSG